MSTPATPDHPGDPVPGRVPSPAEAARSYAAAVRAHLADLPVDAAEELTAGLEADLADAAAESSTPLAARLGDPARYAAELREAAGLPAPAAGATASPRSERGPRPVRPVGPPLRERAAARVRSGRAWVSTRAWWPYLRDLALVLRPAWWLVRAWVVFEVLFRGAGAARGFSPAGLGGLLVLLALAWASVELGRGRWDAVRWLPRARDAGNAVAALALLPVLAVASAGSSRVEYVTDDATSAAASAAAPTGLVLDGQPVANLFPYAADGTPLSGVQLLDDRGRPVTIGADVRAQWEDDGAHPFVPVLDAGGRVRWNAYPLRASATADGAGAATAVALPTATLPALVGAAAPAAAADPSAGAAPTETPDPSASTPAATAPASTPAATPTAAG